MTHHRQIREECGPEMCPTLDAILAAVRDAGGRCDEACDDVRHVKDWVEEVRTTCGNLREALAETMHRLDIADRHRDEWEARAGREEKRAQEADSEAQALSRKLYDLEATLGLT